MFMAFIKHMVSLSDKNRDFVEIFVIYASLQVE